MRHFLCSKPLIASLFSLSLFITTNAQDTDNDGIPDATDNCPLISSISSSQLAYNGVEPVGNQTWEGRLGMVFSTSQTFVVTHLGAYDDGGNGLTRPIQVGIVDAFGNTVVTPIIITGLMGTLVNGHRVVDIPDVS